MKRSSSPLATLVGFSMLIVVVITAWIGADEPKQVAKAPNVVVRSDDIGVRAEVHGKLGLPLGRLATIQGHCVKTEDRKEYGGQSTLSIERVNGVTLDRPVELVLDQFGPSTGNPLKVGKAYELRGYEHGQFHGVPNGAYQEYVRGGKPAFATATDYSFRTEFVFLSAKQL